MRSPNHSFLDQCLIQFDLALRTCVPGSSQARRASPAEELNDGELSPSERRHTAGLMRINHTGEVCAQALYAGQAATARHDETREAMQQAADEEIDHLAWCEDRLQELDSRPSILNPFWYAGSFAIGAIAGLVVITAEPSTPSALTSTIWGALGGILVVLSIVTLDKLKIDDPVGAISVHGVVGLLGLLLVPVTNADVSFSGQIIGAATIFIWVFVASLIVWGILKAVMGIRVSEEDEYEGMDIADCGMEAYPEFSKG